MAMMAPRVVRRLVSWLRWQYWQNSDDVAARAHHAIADTAVESARLVQKLDDLTNHRDPMAQMIRVVKSARMRRREEASRQ
jgi:hypothetical protein